MFNDFEPCRSSLNGLGYLYLLSCIVIISERRNISTNMGLKENYKQTNLLLQAVNLSHASNAISDMKTLVQLREDYLRWREEAKRQIIANKNIPDRMQLVFLKNDPVEADFWQNGGAGLEYPSSRTKEVRRLITDAASKWVDFLSQFELELNPARYDSRSKTLWLLGKDIKISKRAEHYGHDLLMTLFKQPNHVWSMPEILTDWRRPLEGPIKDKRLRDQIYQAGRAVNEKVAGCTQVQDFLKLSSKEIYINSKYL